MNSRVGQAMPDVRSNVRRSPDLLAYPSADLDPQRHLFTAAADFDRDFLAGLLAEDAVAQVVPALHIVLVESQHHVTDLQSCLLGGRAGSNLRDLAGVAVALDAQVAFVATAEPAAP